SQQMAHVRFLFQSRRWYDLIPDQTHSVVTAGYGTFSNSGALGENDYLTAARTPDGALVIAYMPTLRTITVDMSQLAAPGVASWYDPSNGTFTAIAGSPLANTGSRDLTPPGNNAAGDGDWVLVLAAGSVPPDTQPLPVSTGLTTTSVASSRVAFLWTALMDKVGVAPF